MKVYRLDREDARDKWGVMLMPSTGGRAPEAVARHSVGDPRVGSWNSVAVWFNNEAKSLDPSQSRL